MNYTLFFFLLNFILASRLWLTFRDHGANNRDVVVMYIISLLVLPFLQLNTSWFILLLYLTASSLVFWKLEERGRNLALSRSLVLLMHVVVTGLLTSPILPVQFHGHTWEWLAAVQSYFALESGTPTVSLLQLEVTVFGLLMVLNESNILVRLLLNMFNLEPVVISSREVDEGEYNTGRVIGLLERIFVFVFVLMGQYTALGFILAAKGVTRFKDFESRAFAEYVLIGTLLSTLFALVFGWLVMLFL